MTIAIDGVPDAPGDPNTSGVSTASGAAHHTASAPTPAVPAGAAAAAVAAPDSISDSSAKPIGVDKTNADRPARRRRKASTKTRALATSSLSDAEIELLEQLKDRKDAAQAVYMALERAEQAATAAAEVFRALLQPQTRLSVPQNYSDGVATKPGLLRPASAALTGKPCELCGVGLYQSRRGASESRTPQLDG